jgi:hypothetical protein
MKLDATPITVFQEKIVPAGSKLAGWAALVQALAISGPVLRSRVSDRRATVWNDGAAPSCRPARTGSLWMKSSGCSVSSLRIRGSYKHAFALTASF